MRIKNLFLQNVQYAKQASLYLTPNFHSSQINLYKYCANLLQIRQNYYTKNS